MEILHEPFNWLIMSSTWWRIFCKTIIGIFTLVTLENNDFNYYFFLSRAVTGPSVTTIYGMSNPSGRAKPCVDNFLFQAFIGTLENSRWTTLTASWLKNKHICWDSNNHGKNRASITKNLSHFSPLFIFIYQSEDWAEIG